MQQLQCREQQQSLFVGFRARDRPPAPVGESRAQSLAAAENEVLQAGDQGVIVASDVRRIRSAVTQMPAQLVGDGVGQLDGCRCFYAQRDTSSSRSLEIMARQVYSARLCPAGFASLGMADEKRSTVADDCFDSLTMLSRCVSGRGFVASDLPRGELVAR